MASQKLALPLALAWLLAAAAAAGRELPPSAPGALDARLAGLFGGGLVQCWSALLQLRSCSDELAVFLLNGEVNLGPECCGAIQVITRQCWPTLLASVGLTVDQANVLRGYCDAEGEAAAAPPPPPEMGA
ncbi:hypothetical protein Taro_024549 [Colocasia esculenta]|uniref:Prolamin-like domain-containing protein n=1 Tax=Colocasia esculenta TaxID=4460 RepID=A0A843VDZ2_COLES|nr:hypothetical protein [Colocasia esculenta]